MHDRYHRGLERALALARPIYRPWVGIGRQAGVWAITVFVLAAAFVALYVYAPVGAPTGYYFPRHSIWGGSDALYEGVLVERDGCVQTEMGDTVVWPPGTRFEVRDGKLVITGGGGDVTLGEPVAMGGGWYDRGQIAAIAADAAHVPCGDSFFVSNGWAD